MTSLGVSLLIHVVCKVFLGKHATVTYVLTGICVYKFFRSMQNKYQQGIEKIAKASLDLKSSIRELERGEFSNCTIHLSFFFPVSRLCAISMNEMKVKRKVQLS